jgi:hypothetical protein
MTTRILLSVIAAGMLAVAGQARAANFTKKTIDAESLPEPIHQAQPAQPKRAKSLAGPRLTLDMFIEQRQKRLLYLTDRQAGYLRRLIELASPDDPQLPDYLFRLGEAYAEKYRYLNFLARSLDEPIFRAEHPNSELQTSRGAGQQSTKP